MAVQDSYLQETDREISNFISYADARRVAKVQLAQHKAQVAAEQQAAAEPEMEEDLEEPVENPTGVKETDQMPEAVQQFLRSQRQMGVMGGPQESPQPQRYSMDPNMKLDPSKAIEAIFGNEGGKTGQRTALKGSARGKYQIIDSTREMIRQGHFSNMNKNEFESLYRKDPAFEKAVATAHMSDLIKQYGHNALGAWYSPAHVAKGKWDVVPHPEAGNRITVGQYQENAMKRYKTLQNGGTAVHGGWLDQFEIGGEVEPGEEYPYPKPKPAPKGYKKRTKEQREAWNSLLDYVEQKGMASSPELDERDKNLSISLINEFNKANPKKKISPDEIQHYQYELSSINDYTFPQIVTSKPEYAEIWGKRMYNDPYNKDFVNKYRSKVDNWFGQETSTQYYPQYKFTDGKKEIDYGVDYDKYAEAIYQNNQKSKPIAKNKRGGKIRFK